MSETKKPYGSDRPSDDSRKERKQERFTSPFSKDKRPRTVSKTSYKPAGEDRDGEKKSSYNPNFTKDNKLRRTDSESSLPSYKSRTASKSDKPYGDKKFGDKPYGEKKFGDKPYGERKFGDKPYGERKFGDKPYGERKFGDKPYGERKFGDKPYGERKFGDKPYGEKKFGDKPYGEKKFGDKPYGERKFGDKPYGERKFGDKPYGEKKFGDKKFGGKPAGAGKRSFGKSDKDMPKTYGTGEAPIGEYPKFPAPQFDGAIRLNRYIATSGLCSRREADQFILSGLVTVNGVVITELGSKVQPEDVVTYNNNVIQSEKKIFIVMNKPKGFVTTIEDEHAEKTVMDIVKNACTERVYPVGRLDKNSVGVLLLTNDGDLTKQLTHPSYQKKKVYQVSLDKPLTRADMETITSGITLEDGEIFADEVAYVNESKKEIGVEIHSGRNRIVRRMFEHLGYRVQKLDRVYFAGLTKKNLKRGAWRYLTAMEVAMLKSGEYE